MNLMDRYLPIVLLIIIGIGFAALPLMLSYLLTKMIGFSGLDLKAIKEIKNHRKFLPKDRNIKDQKINFLNINEIDGFYVVIILLIIISLQIMFLIPWILNWLTLQLELKLSVALFILTCISGFFYTWKTGILDYYDSP